jgi:hypothetical protein
MDSPLSDANSPLDHYQNNWILPEEFIVSSQPSLFLLDMEKEKTQGLEKVLKKPERERVEKIEKAVVLENEQGLHLKKATKHVEKGKAVLKKASRQVAKVKTAKIIKGLVSDEEKAPKKVYEETLTAEVEKEKIKEEENIVAGTSMEQLKSCLKNIVEMDESALKALCKQKGILPKGRSTMKHKYAFLLLRDAMMQI